MYVCVEDTCNRERVEMKHSHMGHVLKQNVSNISLCTGVFPTYFVDKHTIIANEFNRSLKKTYN